MILFKMKEEQNVTHSCREQRHKRDRLNMSRSMLLMKQTETSGRLNAMIEVKEKRVKVTLNQMTILRHLSHHQQVSLGELASLLGTSSAAATKNVQRLERKRMVKRVVDEWDRRRVLISLTDDGRSMVNEPAE